MVAARFLAAGAGVTLLIASAGLGVNGQASATPKAEASDSSAVTLSGVGEFDGLKVTVSQTQNLVNQVVHIAWTGGKPTKPDFGSLGVNYLQIMQCWSAPDDTEPTREQCEYGGQRAWNGGQNFNSRQMTTGTVIDPLETMYDRWKVDGLSYVPFRSWKDDSTIGPKSSYFDRYTTNEVDGSRTRPDGTGEEFFEVLTGVEAPGLGCGQKSAAGLAPKCYIVVIPRGSTEVDGTPRGMTTGDPLDTTPLMTSNWANRIVFPLQFQPVGQACAIGGDEIPLLGSDRAAEAVGRWQPALCGGREGNFSFTVLSDAEARAKLQSGSPDMAFVTYPLAPDAVAADKPIVYAPISLSGLTVSFNLERQSSSLAADAIRAKDGQRVTGIKLNQRLMAKLLTQAYRYDTAPKPDHVVKNPWDLAQDPEFLALNPQFKELQIPALGHMLVSIGQSDTAALVWKWIWADSDARSWLQGKPDPWGTTLNSVYKGATFPRSDFPRTDNVCVTFTGRAVALCTFDLFPYAADLYAAARAGSRGDPLSFGMYDPLAIPPAYKRTPPQEPGKRAMIVLTDSPLSERFALNPALLRNADGQYTGPDEPALVAAAKAAKPTGVAGVVQPDPAQKVKGAYPLTSFTYAATSPPGLTKAQGAEYARFLTYAVGDGQVLGEAPGQLPPGYVPLPAAFVAQTTKAAAAIAKQAGVTVDGGSTDDTSTGGGTGGGKGSGGKGGGGNGGGSSGSGTTDSGGGYVDPGTTDPGTTDPGTTDPGTTDPGTTTDPGAVGGESQASGNGGDAPSGLDASAQDQPLTEAAALALTPQTPVGLGRFLVVVLLLIGGAAVLAAALLGRSMVRPGTAGAAAISTDSVANPRRSTKGKGTK